MNVLFTSLGKFVPITIINSDAKVPCLAKTTIYIEQKKKKKFTLDVAAMQMCNIIAFLASSTTSA